MTDATTQSAWAYQGSADIADNVAERVETLREGIDEELHPDDLKSQIDEIEKRLEDLRTELDEMPGY